jgi:hypothetical protein
MAWNGAASGRMMVAVTVAERLDLLDRPRLDLVVAGARVDLLAVVRGDRLLVAEEGMERRLGSGVCNLAMLS